MHDRRAERRFFVAGPLYAADLVEQLERDAGEGRGQLGYFVHDLGRMVVVHVVAHRLCEVLSDAPLFLALAGFHYRTDAINASFGVDECAVFLEERRSGQEYVRELGGLVQEQVLHDDALHARQCRFDVQRVRVGLREVLALDVHALEFAGDRGVEHVRDPEARLGVDGHAPVTLESASHLVVLDRPVTRQLVRERTDVTGALHVVLSAQRIHANTIATDVAGRHCEVGHAHDHGRALAVLGNAEAVINGAIFRTGIQAGCTANVVGRHAADLGNHFR